MKKIQIEMDVFNESQKALYDLCNVVKYYENLSHELLQRDNWRGFGVDEGSLEMATFSMQYLKKVYNQTEGRQLYQVVVYLTNQELMSFGTSMYFSKENAAKCIGEFLLEKGLQSICFMFDGNGYVLFRFVINSVFSVTGKKFSGIQKLTDAIKENLFYVMHPYMKV